MWDCCGADGANTSADSDCGHRDSDGDEPGAAIKLDSKHKNGVVRVESITYNINSDMNGWFTPNAHQGPGAPTKVGRYVRTCSIYIVAVIWAMILISIMKLSFDEHTSILWMQGVAMLVTAMVSGPLPAIVFGIANPHVMTPWESLTRHVWLWAATAIVNFLAFLYRPPRHDPDMDEDQWSNEAAISQSIVYFTYILTQCQFTYEYWQGDSALLLYTLCILLVWTTGCGIAGYTTIYWTLFNTFSLFVYAATWGGAVLLYAYLQLWQTPTPSFMQSARFYCQTLTYFWSVSLPLIIGAVIVQSMQSWINTKCEATLAFVLTTTVVLTLIGYVWEMVINIAFEDDHGHTIVFMFPFQLCEDFYFQILFMQVITLSFMLLL